MRNPSLCQINGLFESDHSQLYMIYDMMGKIIQKIDESLSKMLYQTPAVSPKNR